ncbi:hypothetical protein [Rhizobium sp. BE258]|jgi:hypothetical protein|uniref:hypothetical protein n=1 Tax=Rhizobium sp. BE258 TaxID=2817722 RepID=UPI002854C9A6|nr:hypothetical protein [Rhizobium sp. BE258]MDR7146146.1 hypothetical protein [Rhizobium sp. BE258]
MSYVKSIREGFLGRAFAVIGAANAVSAAVDAGRRPQGRHLKVLGIDADVFDHIRR